MRTLHNSTSLADRLIALLTAKHLPVWLGLLGAVLMLPCLDDGLQLDDYLQRSALVEPGQRSGLRVFEFFTGDPAVQQRLQEKGWAQPWWTAPGFRHRLFRYLSAASMQLDYWLWPDQPAWMHAHSLLWLAVLIVCATWFYRQVLGNHWTAGLAALLYAIDDAHALPAAYLANRNALISTAFGVLSIACHARARQHAWKAGVLLSPLCMALALCAGEMAVATLAWLLAYALFLDRAPMRQRILALLPNAAVGLGWLLWYRLGGFGASGSGYYDDPVGDPLGFAANVAQHIPRLLLGQWTPIPAEFAWGSSMLAVSVCVTALLLLLLVPLVAREPAARFFAFGAALSLLPIAATGPMNRLLFFVGLGSMGLLSIGLARLFMYIGSPSRPRGGRLLALALSALLLIMHVALAPFGGFAMVNFQARVSNAHVAAMASVPHDTAISDQDLVLLNPPDYPYAAMSIAPYKRMQGLPVARRLRALVAANTDLQVTRVSSDTLQVTLGAGLFTDPFSRYFRGKQFAFHPGERITLPGLSIQIEALNSAGDPERLSYHFEHPLEHASLRWLQYRDGRYLPWQPPAVGQSTHLAAPGSFFQ